MKLKNIGPDDRSIPSAKVKIAKGEAVEIGSELGQVPKAIANEYSRDEPERWQIITDEIPAEGKKAGTK